MQVAVPVENGKLLFLPLENTSFANQNFPQELDIEQAWDFYIDLDIYVNNIRDNSIPKYKDKRGNKKISFEVVDSTEKKYVLKNNVLIKIFWRRMKHWRNSRIKQWDGSGAQHISSSASR